MPDAIDRPNRSANGLAVTIAAVTIALAAGIVMHVRPLNGPPYYPWPWGRLPAARTLGVAAMIVAQLGAIALAVRFAGARWLVASVAIAIGSLALRVGACAMLSDPIGLTYAAEVIRDPHVGSFFTVAESLSGVPWTLAEYPQLMPQFPVHAMHKAPAPMLFWSAMLRVTRGDADLAARIGALLVGLASAAAIPLVALSARQLGATSRGALHAAALLSLAPGAIVFFPLFDPAYTTWTLVGMVAWSAAGRGWARWGAAFGAWLAATFFVVFNVLPIGLPLALLGLWRADGTIGTRAKRVAVCGGVALVVAGVGIAAMQLAFGYDAIATFRAALAQQSAMQATFGARLRPFPQTIVWDLYDAALGVGFAPAAIALTLASRGGPLRALATIGVGTGLVVAIASLLPVETSRVWNFLFPLIAIPSGAWLAERSRAARVAIYASVALVLLAAIHALVFMAAAPVIDG